jgi:hypothetical protein
VKYYLVSDFLAYAAPDGNKQPGHRKRMPDGAILTEGTRNITVRWKIISSEAIAMVLFTVLGSDTDRATRSMDR